MLKILNTSKDRSILTKYTWWQVSLGNTDELLIIGTANSYNDGKWHRLDAARILTKCSLKVDREILKMDSAAREDSIGKFYL